MLKNYLGVDKLDCSIMRGKEYAKLDTNIFQIPSSQFYRSHYP
jgi:hypothetical protein